MAAPTRRAIHFCFARWVNAEFVNRFFLLCYICEVGQLLVVEGRIANDRLKKNDSGTPKRVGRSSSTDQPLSTFLAKTAFSVATKMPALQATYVPFLNPRRSPTWLVLWMPRRAPNTVRRSAAQRCPSGPSRFTSPNSHTSSAQMSGPPPLITRQQIIIQVFHATVVCGSLACQNTQITFHLRRYIPERNIKAHKQRHNS